MTSQLVTLINESTLVSAGELAAIGAALNEQLVRDFNQSGWVRRSLAPAADVATATAPAPGSWGLYIRDSSDQQGALGYHDELSGQPVGYVFAQDTLNDGEQVSAVCSHELLEMLCDPYVARPKVIRRPGTNRYYIVEVGDPVQSGDYDVGTGLKVADFALPAWWGLSSFRPTSFRGTAVKPWQVTPGGYMSYEVNGAWHQIYAQRADGKTVPADPDDLPTHRGRPMIRRMLVESGRLQPQRIEASGPAPADADEPDAF